MKKIILAFVLTLSLFFAAAQNDDNPRPVPEEFKTIKMPKFPSADFPKKSIKVADIQIIQMVSDSVRLGYVLKGVDNHAVQLKPAKPLTDMLQEQIIRMYKNDYDKEGARILFILKELRIGEKLDLTEYAYTRFDAEAYISTDAVHYKFVTSIDTVFVKSSGGDVTAWHGEDIQEALRLFVNETLQAAKELPGEGATGMTIGQIKELKKQKTDMLILAAAVYNEGAYANFQEFLDNKPSILLYQPVTVGKRKVKLIQMKDNNQVDTLSVWGLCKNGELYKYEESFLIPIEKQGNGFIISNYVKLAGRRNNNNLGAMYGLIGAIGDELIREANEKKQKEKPMLIKSIPYIKNENKQPEASCIDMKTGELSF